MKGLTVVFYSMFLLAMAVFSARFAFAFEVIERFEYDLRWLGIKAGTAELEVGKEGENIRIVSTARSDRWVSVFYPVDDRVESVFKVGPSGALPISFVKRLREGRFRRHREYLFDNGAGKVFLNDHLKGEKAEFAVPLTVFDPLSALYRMRALPLRVGESVYLPVFDDKKLWNVEAKVLRKERVKTPLGSFDTIVVKPILQSEGIFSGSGDILIWLADDGRRVPVLMKTELDIGSVTAVLVRAPRAVPRAPLNGVK